MAEKDTGEKAKDFLVYGPVGLALYLRDTAPSFLKLFVARGRAELDQRKRSVGDQLGQAKAVGEFASTYGGSQAKTFIAEGLAKVKARAEETLGALGALVPQPDNDGDAPATSTDDAPAAETAPPAPAEAEVEPDAVTEVPGPVAFSPPPGAEEDDTSPNEITDISWSGNGSLAIPDYDELSASQVVDRLEGLGESELEAIRTYELGHRARNTVLGKIDQLTRR